MLPLDIEFILSFLINIGRAGGINVALGKPAYQTSTLGDLVAENAVDGSISLCMHTLSAKTSWWVDLGQMFFISSIKIYNRMDCYSSRLRNVQIYIGYEQRSNKSLVGFHPGPVGSTVTFPFDPPIHGRWVQINRNPPYSRFHFCEVEVEGDILPHIGREHGFTKFTKVADVMPVGTPFLLLPDVTPFMCVFMCHANMNCSYVMSDPGDLSCEMYNSVPYSTAQSDTRILFMSL